VSKTSRYNQGRWTDPLSPRHPGVYGSRSHRFHQVRRRLLILTDAPRFETARWVSSRFFMNCEERIDVVAMDPENLTSAEAAFLHSLRRVRIA
jgi:hypothetical protein